MSADDAKKNSKQRYHCYVNINMFGIIELNTHFKNAVLYFFQQIYYHKKGEKNQFFFKIYKIQELVTFFY